MPVTFKVASHSAEQVKTRAFHAKPDAEQLLIQTRGVKQSETPVKELLQSSFSGVEHNLKKIIPQGNGFIDTVLQAYNHHHHLVLRPDDVWIAILGQFSFYVNAHAEELRSQFVAHEGQRVLKIITGGTRYTVDFGALAEQMAGLIDENLVDKELKDWILPDFTTTRENDTVVSSVLMMSTLKAYFRYEIHLRCGLPSVTLEGERSDWVNLLNRVEKLDSFGDEPKAWAGLLRPVLSRFVSSFDGSPDLDFWSKICHYQSGGSGPSYVCGWITAFGVWSNEGVWQGPNLSGGGVTMPTIHWHENTLYQLKLDDAEYGCLDTNKIPSGVSEVDVLLNDNGQEFKCMMLAGHAASLKGGAKGDTLSPVPAWFMFIK